MYPLVLLLSLLSTASASSVTSISCLDADPLERINDTCVAEGILATPWSTNELETAPSPKSLQVGWYTTVTSDGHPLLLLNITWEQEKSKVKKGVTGYYIEVKSHNNQGTGFQRKFHIRLNDSDLQGGGMMQFNYDQCCSHLYPQPGGRNGDIIPGQDMTVILHALPMYNKGNNFQSQAVRSKVEIPDCYTSPMRGTSVCPPPDDDEGTIAPYDPYDSDPYYDPYEDPDYPGVDIYDQYGSTIPQEVSVDKTPPTTYIVALVVTGVVVALFAFVLFALKGKYKPASKEEKIAPGSGGKDVIILVPTAGVTGRPPVWEFTQHLATKLHNHVTNDVTSSNDEKVTVDCNLWHLTSTGPQSNWLADVMARHRSRGHDSHVVLVGDAMNNELPKVATDDGTQGWHPTHSCQISVLHFGRDDDVITSGDDNSSPSTIHRRRRRRHFRLPGDVTKLMCELTGSQPDDVIVSELRALADKVVMTSSSQPEQV